MLINDGSQSFTYFLTQKSNILHVLFAFFFSPFLLFIFLIFLVFIIFFVYFMSFMSFCPFCHFWNCPLCVPLFCLWIFNDSTFIYIIPLLLLEIVSYKGLTGSHSVEFLYLLLYFFRFFNQIVVISFLFSWSQNIFVRIHLLFSL